MGNRYYKVKDVRKCIADGCHEIDEFLETYFVLYECDECLVLMRNGIKYAIAKKHDKFFKQIDDSYQGAINRLDDKLVKFIECNQGVIVDLAAENNVCMMLRKEINQKTDEELQKNLNAYSRLCRKKR